MLYINNTFVTAVTAQKHIVCEEEINFKIKIFSFVCFPIYFLLSFAD